MKLNKYIKGFAFSLCLGTVISGLSAHALEMDRKNRRNTRKDLYNLMNQSSAQGSCKEKFENLIANRGNPYACEYMRLICEHVDENRAQKRAAIFSKIIEEEGQERYIYASEYARLIVNYRLDEERAKKEAEIINEEISKGKSNTFAREYAIYVVEYKLNEEKARKQAKIYEEEID